MMDTRKTYNLTKGLITVLPIIVNTLFAVTAVVYYQTGTNLSPHWYALFGHSVAFSLLLVFLSYLFRFCSWHHVLCFAMLLCISLEELSAEGLIALNAAFFMSAGISTLGLITATCLRWKPFTRASRALSGTSRNGLMTGIARCSRMMNMLNCRHASKLSTK